MGKKVATANQLETLMLAETRYAQIPVRAVLIFLLVITSLSPGAWAATGHCSCYSPEQCLVDGARMPFFAAGPTAPVPAVFRPVTSRARTVL
jgi:hypothetical protein